MNNIYFTHDGKNRPYKVEINNDTLTCYKKIIDCYTFEDCYNFTQIFIGGINGENPEMSNEEKIGNTICFNTQELFGEKSKFNYIYIGDNIFKFSTPEVIKNYYSYLNEKDKPYPCAVSENYVYLIKEKLYYPIKYYKNPHKDFDFGKTFLEKNKLELEFKNMKIY